MVSRVTLLAMSLGTHRPADALTTPSARPRRTVRRALALVLTAALALLVVPPAHAATTTSLTLTMDKTPRSGESIWFSGTWKVNGKGTSNKSISLDYRRKGSTRWTSAGVTRSRTGGAWALRFKPAASYEYRARAEAWGSTPGALSPYRQATFVSNKRSIESRVNVLGWRAGTSNGLRTVDVPGTQKVRYDSRTTMLLVEVTTSERVRTWTVEGEIRKAYTAKGSAKGELGYPLGDARCRLLDDGCLQRFSNGVIYDNAFKSPVVLLGKKHSVLEVIAVARSQVGYAAPASNISRYNTWVGTTNAWCSIFQSWVGAASGHESTIRTYGNFPDFHSWAVRSLGRKSAPTIGAIAFFDTHTSDGVSAATHAGLVIGYSSSAIYTIEGNTSNPATGTGRGVYYKTRPRSMPMYYVYPQY